MSTASEIFSENVELSDEDRALVRIYGDIGRSVDELAYTPEFDELFKRYREAGYQAKKHEVFRRLLLLRKSGLLPRLFRASA